MQNTSFAGRIKGWLIKAAVLVIAAIVLAVVVSVAFDSPTPKPPATTSAPIVQDSTTEATTTAETTPTQAPAATSAPQTRQVVVSSQIVKQVGSKYRYFFDIRNNDQAPFTGEVKIKLITANGLTVGSDTFSSTQPITTGLGASVYLEANTGPVAVHGDNGVATFTYEVFVDGTAVNQGEGQVSAKYEAL